MSALIISDTLHVPAESRIRILILTFRSYPGISGLQAMDHLIYTPRASRVEDPDPDSRISVISGLQALDHLRYTPRAS